MDNILIAEIRRVLRGAQGKKIIIWGTANIAAYIFSTIRALGQEAAYFVDSSEEAQGRLYFGREVKSPYDITYEKLDAIVVILGFTNSAEVEGIAKEIGLTMDVNCFDLKKMEQPKRCDLFDPFLGYSRTDDVEGFKIFHPGEKKKIVILGGSAADWSVSHIHAWPFYLSERLAREGFSYSVYNGAVVGYYSSQELLKCLRDCLPLRPELVISYSGVNDAGWVKSDRAHPYVCDYLFDNCEKIVKKTAVARSGVNRIEKISYGQEWQKGDTDLWIDNMRIMHAMCGEFGISFFSFLQPTQFYGDYPLTEVEQTVLQEQYGQEHLAKVRTFFRDAAKATEAYDYMYDFTNIFSGTAGVFYDAMHSDERGNQIIADRVFETIRRRLE